MKLNIKIILFAAFIFFICISSVSANDLNSSDLNLNDTYSASNVLSINDNPILADSEITVDDWDDLQYYCSKNDQNYVLKLKENTNYYPTNPNEEIYQIKINNNVTIIGSSGAYFGDSSPNARPINYLSIQVPENSGYGITLKNVTFKWIATEYQPDAVFLKMAGNANNRIENCIFTNITLTGGHSSVIHIMKGDLFVNNCSFTDITSDYGCLSVYNPDDDPTKICTRARAEVTDSYFEGNYARTEPGCINNCGVLVVRNSTFYKNSAFWWAGAIHTHGGANTTIYDSNFTDNVAGWNGGALYTYSYLQIYNTIFKGNNCTTNNGGGAIGACKYLHAPYVYVEDSLFEDNENLCWSLSELSTTGTGRGGAISIMDEGALTVLNTTFIENSASIGTAICALDQGSHGSPDVTLIGNRFINHTRVSDVLVIRLAYDSKCVIENNYYLRNSIEFSKLKLTADDRVGDEVTLHIDATLKNPNYYDSDILKKSGYDVYIDGTYLKTVNGTDFTLNLKNVEKAQVYVVPSISTSKSNEVSVGMPTEYIYVSQKYGKDTNDGLSETTPVLKLSKAIELANTTGNIKIMDGTFSEKDLNINYNLTIVGVEGVAISSKGNIFNIGDVDVEFKNITFNKCKQSSSTSTSERIIKHSSGILVLENCNFESNEYGIALIETGGTIEAEGLTFKSNSGMLIVADNYVISSSVFDSNTANTAKATSLIKSSNGFKCSVISSNFTDNNLKYGCIYFGASNSNQNTLTVSDCIFSENVGNDGASCLYMYNYGVLNVYCSLFIFNNDIGSSSAVIVTSAEAHISDSIFLGNTFSNKFNAIINAKSATNLNKIHCSGNWFGNTQEDYNTTPLISSSSDCDYWIFLNASADKTSIFQQENAVVNFNLNNVYNKDGNVTYWDSSKLPTVKLSISTTGGKSSEKTVTLVYGTARTIFTLTDIEGSLKASFNNVNAVVNFTEAKVNPNMNVSFAENIFVDDTETIEITLPDNATGSLNIVCGEYNDTKDIKGSKTIFSLENLPAGENKCIITYSGDEYYSLIKQTAVINVNKYNSTTTISVGEINVGKDVVINIAVAPSLTGNVTLNINGNETVLTLVNSKASYTINSIQRGNYIIKASYNGNYKYLTSKDETKFGVDKLATPLVVNVGDIVYGQDAVVEVTLNTDAVGNVTVVVDDKNKSSELKNGKAIINISDLNAGDKIIYAFYEGSNVYNSTNNRTSFKVTMATTPIAINVNDVMVGQNVNVEVVVLSGVDGNITLNFNNQNVSKPIPRTGKVSFSLSDLSQGNYKVSATLNSDNYFTISNSTSFNVFDFETPIWPNEGYDCGNTGKSPYETDSNGAILWSYNISGEVIANMVIDSKGNIYLITSNGVYSIGDNANELWKYGPAHEGNYSGLAIGRDIVIVPESGNTLHFINQTTGKKFGNSNIYQGSSLFAPVVDSNANVYISSEFQHASEDYKLVVIGYDLWKNGGEPILISLGNSKPSSAPVIVSENIVAVACDDSLKIIDTANKRIISSIKGNSNGIRPVVGPGNLIYSVLDDKLMEIDSQGTIIWQSKITDGAGSYLVIDEENGLYSLNANGKLCKYDIIDGKESLMSDLTFTTGILVDNEGNIYLGSNEIIYAFDNNANILWKSDLSSTIVGTPIMGENANIYVATAENLYALSKGDLKNNTITISAADVNIGEEVLINITSDKLATGTLTVQITSGTYDNVSTILLDGRDVQIALSNLDAGSYEVNVTYSGDLRYNPMSKSAKFNINKDKSIINILTSDVYYSGQFMAELVDSTLKPIVGETLIVVIDAEKHELTTDNDGRIYLNLSLNAGKHNVNVNFKGSTNYSNSSGASTVNVLSTIQSDDMKRGYNSGVDFRAKFLAADGQALSNAQVIFMANNVRYELTTDDSGFAVLNEKLAVGSYSITIVNPLTGENATNNLVIAPRITNNYYLTMDYLEGPYFKVRIIGDDGNYVGAGEEVTFKVGNKFYTAKTIANGYAGIKINEVPGKYKVKAYYKGYCVSNKVVVKQVLKAYNVVLKKAKSYKFSAYLKKSNGKAIKYKKIYFKINGKTYVAKTNKKGIATVTIKLKLKPGKYVIISSYSKTSIKNKIKIK